MEFTKEDYETFYSIITNKKTLNKTKHEFMKIIEDNGTNEFFVTEMDIDIDLSEGINSIHIIPIRKDNNLIELSFNSYGQFEYINHRTDSKSWIIVLSVIGAILIIIIVALIICKKNNSSNKIDINGPILSKDVELN